MKRKTFLGDYDYWEYLHFLEDRLSSNLLNEYIRVQKIIIDTIKITLDKTAESARKIIPQSQWNDLELEEKARLVIFMSLNKIKTLVNKDADEDFDVNL